MARTFNARYPGRCRACGKRFPAGTRVHWFGRGRTEHASCPTAPAPAPVAAGHDDWDDDGDYRRQRARDDADYEAGKRDADSWRFVRDAFGESAAAAWEMDNDPEAPGAPGGGGWFGRG